MNTMASSSPPSVSIFQSRPLIGTGNESRNADGIILVHDLTDPSSLAAIDHTWMGEVSAFSSGTKSPSLAVVGNKVDLKRSNPQDPNLAAGQGDAHFDIDDSQLSGLARFEVSAKSGEGVEEVFLNIADDMMAKYNSKLSTREVTEETRYMRPGRGISLMSRSEAGGGLFGACCSLL
mmetsp:Transcript_69000/g.192827  ORF Transcript_69000/g.192827 Transcript_69000/m.192827 type:complete len:177 (+) Transcript_69000:504-1034(+)